MLGSFWAAWQLVCEEKRCFNEPGLPAVNSADTGDIDVNFGLDGWHEDKFKQLLT